MATKSIGVFPPEALAQRRRLFATLERAFDVRFHARQWGDYRDVAALIAFDDGDDRLDASARLGRPAFVVSSTGGRCAGADPVPVTFGDRTDRRLRRRVLVEDAAPSEPLPTTPLRGDALASLGDLRVWTREGQVPHHVDRVAFAPVELTAGERLKDHLQAGQFLTLLPLIQFLRDVCDEVGSSAIPLRATFILDDLNLNWPSYGYLRYGDLAPHAARHNYHTAIAMVPIDARFAHPRAVRLFKHQSRLSLVIHGNNHLKSELTRPSTKEDAARLATQALRRIERFERKYGLTVSRTMVPPHERCSVLMLDALLHSGFDAVCYAYGVDHDDALIDWHPADVDLAGALPALHREPLFCSRDEMTLRAFLGKPLILYGHHGDVGPNLDLLEEAAGNVNRAGDVTWMSVDGIVQSNFSSRVEDGVLWLRPFTRRMRVKTPDGVTHVAVEATSGTGTWCVTPAPAPGSSGHWVTVTDPCVPVPIGAETELDLRLVPTVEASMAPNLLPGWSPWPSVRRWLTEGRDRLLPLLGR